MLSKSEAFGNVNLATSSKTSVIQSMPCLEAPSSESIVGRYHQRQPNWRW